MATGMGKSRITKRPPPPIKPKKRKPSNVYDRVAYHNQINAEREAKGYPPMIEKPK